MSYSFLATNIVFIFIIETINTIIFIYFSIFIYYSYQKKRKTPVITEKYLNFEFQGGKTERVNKMENESYENEEYEKDCREKEEYEDNEKVEEYNDYKEDEDDEVY